MKILVIGGTGLIGGAVVKRLQARHQVITAGSRTGDIQVDITQLDSIKNLYNEVKQLDGVIVASGKVVFAHLEKMSHQDYIIGINNKLMGQVNLVQEGVKSINPGGSFTLTSGILNRDPIVQGSSAAMVNGAIDGFVKASAIELPHGIRINAVSPTVITEALSVYEPYFRGFKPVDADTAALAYEKSVEGQQTGQVYHVG